MPSRRQIPDRGMPDRVTVEPCIGHTDRGLVYGDPIEHVRANLNAGRGRHTRIETGVGAFTIERTTDAVLDPVSLPTLSRITNEATGNPLTVGQIVEFDQPPMQRFLVVSLGQLVEG